jgi:hypothetical protein
LIYKFLYNDKPTDIFKYNKIQEAVKRGFVSAQDQYCLSLLYTKLGPEIIEIVRKYLA